MINIKDWIRKGITPYSLNIGDNINTVTTLELFKNPIHYGSNENGYYYLPNGFRVGFCGDTIDEISVDFNFPGVKLIYEDGEIEFDLTTKKIHEVLNFLNEIFIDWYSLRSNQTDYLNVVLLKTGIVFEFDVYEGTLSKIAKSNLNLDNFEMEKNS